MKAFTAAVYGGSGYLGSEAVRRLLAHPEIELRHVYAADHIGQRLSEALPNLEGKTDLMIEPVNAEAPPAVDAFLLALPHSVSHRLVGKLLGSSARIIDMSGAFRMKDPARYEATYGERHPLPELLGEFVYGLPELNRAAIKKTRFVASPGCFATTAELGLLPLARAGLLEGRVSSVGITGSSGSGATPSATTHHPTRMNNLRAYKPLQHQHGPEIVETLNLAGARGMELDFVPISAPLSRGILVTSFARVPAAYDAERLAALYRETYGGERFVIVPRSRLPEVVAVSGSNYAEVGVAVGEPEAGQRVVTAISALDNLVKGGAGQAIQNLNLMLGLEESLSLTAPAAYP
jgi:N-acetyl-gamma-glutamyl-phosphate/LysW-gamma-L-alpha-aminoadipyl-6-phosphate reductase